MDLYFTKWHFKGECWKTFVFVELYGCVISVHTSLFLKGIETVCVQLCSQIKYFLLTCIL